MEDHPEIKDINDINDFLDPSLTCFDYVESNFHSGQTHNNDAYQNMYLSTHIPGNSPYNDFHLYSCEWLPDQIKIYIDGLLFFRLEGDFTYYYTDIYGNPKAVNPVHELNVDMPMMIAGMASNGCKRDPGGHNCGYNNGDTYYDYDVGYFRYYKLKKDCDHAFMEGTSANPVYDICNYSLNDHKVHGYVQLGENGCTNCSAIYNHACSAHTVSIRASSIEFEDGFEITGEAGDFYACDVDCDLLPD